MQDKDITELLVIKFGAAETVRFLSNKIIKANASGATATAEGNPHKAALQLGVAKVYQELLLQIVQDRKHDSAIDTLTNK